MSRLIIRCSHAASPVSASKGRKVRVTWTITDSFRSCAWWVLVGGTLWRSRYCQSFNLGANCQMRLASLVTTGPDTLSDCGKYGEPVNFFPDFAVEELECIELSVLSGTDARNISFHHFFHRHLGFGDAMVAYFWWFLYHHRSKYIFLLVRRRTARWAILVANRLSQLMWRCPFAAKFFIRYGRQSRYWRGRSISGRAGTRSEWVGAWTLTFSRGQTTLWLSSAS